MRSASHAEVLGSATFVKKSIRTLMLRTVHVNGVVQDDSKWGLGKDVSHSGAILVPRLRREVKGCAMIATKSARDYSVTIVISPLRESRDATHAAIAKQFSICVLYVNLWSEQARICNASPAGLPKGNSALLTARRRPTRTATNSDTAGDGITNSSASRAAMKRMTARTSPSALRAERRWHCGVRTAAQQMNGRVDFARHA